MLTMKQPDTFTIERSLTLAASEYTSTLRARKAFEPEETVGYLIGERNVVKEYSTVQYGPSNRDNIKLVSEFMYINHSCDPNVALDLSSSSPSEWHIRAIKTIQPGDESKRYMKMSRPKTKQMTVTYFYPSTEWELKQPFECKCGSSSCLGYISGARYLRIDELLFRKEIGTWILELAHQQIAEEVGRTSW